MRNPPTGEIHTPSRNTCTTFNWRKHTAHEVCVLENIHSRKTEPRFHSHPSVRVFRRFVVVPYSESGDRLRPAEAYSECVIRSGREGNQPHVFIICGDVHPIKQPDTGRKQDLKKKPKTRSISILIHRRYLSPTCPEFEGRCCTRGGR